MSMSANYLNSVAWIINFITVLFVCGDWWYIEWIRSIAVYVYKVAQPTVLERVESAQLRTYNIWDAIRYIHRKKKYYMILNAYIYKNEVYIHIVLIAE